MTSLTHEQAHELIQHPYLADDDRLALRRHLAQCGDCAAYAAFHLRLSRQLPQQPVRLQPTAAQRVAVLAAARPGRVSPDIPSPLMSFASLAAIMVLLVASWALFARDQRAGPSAQVDLLVSPVQAVTDPRGRVILDIVPAPSLAGNLIGEPLQQEVLIYLPPSYSTGNKRYPVVYALHHDGEIASPNLTGWLASTTRGAANVALRNGLSKEMILVVPKSSNALGLPNYFVTSPVIGDWQSYLAFDLVDYIDANYRTIPEAESRGVFGESAAGWAALQLGTTHRDRFSAVYLSGPLFLAPGALEHTDAMSERIRPAIEKLFSRADEWPANEAVNSMASEMRALSGRLTLYSTIGYGISLVPDPDGRPPYFEYPFTGSSDQPNAVIWQRWESGLGDVPGKIERARDGLEGLALAVSIYSDRRDPFDQPNEGPKYLSEQLDEAGIPHRYIELPSNLPMIRELAEQSLPFFSENLSFKP